MYYLFRDGERIMRALPEMLPLERSQSEAIFARTRDVISASLYGVLVIAIIQGALGGLAFWALDLPSAIVWAVVMTFLSMIPMAGSFLVWVPAAIYLGITGHWGKALILVAWGTLVIGTVDNFLRPKLVGERTRLHELFIFFSVLGGLKVFGVLGIVLGPVVLAITLALLDVFRHAERSKATTLKSDDVR
jgi:predicted PurR-regulated permease PerM